VVTAPRSAAEIHDIKSLEGRTVGISGLGNADHALTLYLLKQADADAGKVKFAIMGVNLLEALRQGQVDAGLVQEPALTLLQKAGARVLVNGMDLNDARRYLGGTYEFMASPCAPKNSNGAGLRRSLSPRRSPTRCKDFAR
jgi:NitT/TauT family transport system substrate-binding protein